MKEQNVGGWEPAWFGWLGQVSNICLVLGRTNVLFSSRQTTFFKYFFGVPHLATFKFIFFFYVTARPCWGLNPRHLGHEQDALTIRPRDFQPGGRKGLYLGYIFFFVVIWSWLATSFSFHPYEAGFYKPTLLKVHPPFCRITAYATMPG